MANFITQADHSANNSIPFPGHKDGIEVEATQINLDAGDEVLKQNSQKAYLENYAPERADENAPRITMAAVLQHDEEVEKKRSDIIEFIRAHSDWLAFREEWMRNREMRFMMMSARDAVQLNDFVSRHEVKEKLRDHLCKGGMGREVAEKAIKAFKEYTDLKRQEHAGTLDSTERARMEELEQSRLVKFAQKHAVRLAKKYGLQIDSEEAPEIVSSASSLQKTSFSLWLDQVKTITNSSEEAKPVQRDVDIQVRIISMHPEDNGLRQNFGYQAKGDMPPRSNMDYSQQKRAEAEPALVPR